MESPAQFTAGGVVIGSTISVRCASRGKKMVVIGRTIRTFFCGRQVVIHSTICAVGKNRLLLSAAHFGISSAFQTCPDRVVIQRTFPAVGLLSGAQFPNCRILAAVVIDGTFLKKSTVQRTAGIVIHGTIRFFRGRAVVIRRTIRKNPFFLRRVLPWVVSLRTVCPAGAGVVIDGTIQGFFCTGCYSAHISPRQDFPSAPLECCAHFSLFLFSRPGLLYSTLFKNPTNFLCRHFPAKKLFYCCYAPHIVAFYTFVLECCAQRRCNKAHICIGIFDIAILLF